MRWLALVVVAVMGAVAHAEGDRALSVGLGYATFSVPGKAMGNMQPPSLSPDLGGTLGVSYEHGIGTDLGLRFELAGGLFTGGVAAPVSKGGKKPPAAPSGTSFAGLGDAGVVFRFDVLKYVPYAFGGLGGVVSGGGPIDRGTDFVVVVGGGVDWLASHTRSYGLEARLASFGGNITVFTFSFRGSIRWGYF